MIEPVTVLPPDPLRRVVVDSQRIAARRHPLYALFEVDVTRARQRLRDHAARTGTRLSFTAWVVACVGRAVAAFPDVQVYRDWRGRRICFHGVDAATLVEIEVGGASFPLVHVLRDVHVRDVAALTAELRNRQRDPAEGISRGSRLLAFMPGFLRRFVFRRWRASPWRMKRHAGTVVVSAVGMFGQGAGWGLGLMPLHTLGVTVGGIGRRPVLVDGQLEEHEFLCLTVALDHDVVDGAPAARFVARLGELLEQAEGLGEREPPRQAPDVAPPSAG